jgi:hypothetical protein
VNWTSIASSVSANYGANYTWPQVPILRTSSAKIKVEDSDNSAINGTSPNPFNIVGKLELSVPNDGTQNWQILGNATLIVWNSTAVNTVNIYYSTNGSAGPFNYSTSVNATLGSIASPIMPGSRLPMLLMKMCLIPCPQMISGLWKSLILLSPRMA